MGTQHHLASQACEYLSEDPDIRIHQLGRILGITTRHLRRIFKASVGETPKDYRSRVRIEKAKQQIVNRNYKKISDVAYDNGFSDPTHFCREFKKNTGVTPSRYGNRHRGVSKCS